MPKKFLILVISVFCSFSHLIGQTQRELTYKTVGDVNLNMLIYHPENITAKDTLPAMIFFFGGGWETGNRSQFQYYAVNYAQKGIITILADYRISSIHGTTPFESLKDAKSAVRYLKRHADELQIDTMRLIASGGSAGGHLAAACFTNETINEDTDPMEFSSKPKVLVLFNPAVDNSAAGYGYDRLGDRWEEFSPLHNVRSPFPPTIFLLGTNDNLIPVSTGQEFKQKIEQVGGRCDLILFAGAKHGFFNLTENREAVISHIDVFFQSIDYMANSGTDTNGLIDDDIAGVSLNFTGRYLQITNKTADLKANIYNMTGLRMGSLKSGEQFTFSQAGHYLVQINMADKSIIKKIAVI